MRTPQQQAQLREEAIALRLAGKSVRQIQEALSDTFGLVARTTLNELLWDTPPAEWTRRPNAKDDLRDRAREMRAQGRTYNEIRAELGVSKSSVSLWVRDLPVPEPFQYTNNENRKEGHRRYYAALSAAHSAETQAAAAEIGELTDREVLIAGAIAYWCEGSKNKPYRKSNRVVFVNGDPGLIRFYLRFLGIAGVNRDDLIFTVQIHENADVAAAQQFWLDITGAELSQFRAPTLKHHTPKTNRKNVGESYHGCLRIEVRRSAVLYRKIEGWATGAMAA